jgi:hypothetical protein
LPNKRRGPRIQWISHDTGEAEMKNSRSFGFMDAMIFVAAAAVFLAGARQVVFYRGDGLFLGTRIGSHPYPRTIPGWLDLLAPFLATTAPALLIVRLRQPRPKFRRLVRQPGTAACLAITVTLIFESIIALLFLALRGELVQSNHPLLVVWLYSSLRTQNLGLAVASTWAALGLAGQWRPDKGWIDRTGRLLGFCSIAHYFAVYTAAAVGL